MITKENVSDIIVAIEEGQTDAFHKKHKKLSNDEKPSLYAGVIIGDAIDEQTRAINILAEAVQELADTGISVNVDVDTDAFAVAIVEAASNVTVTIKDLVEITNIINIGETARKLENTAKDLVHTSEKLVFLQGGK